MKSAAANTLKPIFLFLSLLLLSCHSVRPEAKASGSEGTAINLGLVVHAPVTVPFREVRDVRDIPASVVRRLGNGIANPRADFNATDVVRDSRLPWRRLIVGGISDLYCVLSYEKGGIGLTYLVSVFEYTSADAKPIFVTYEDVTTLLQAKTLLESSKTRNEISSGYY